MKALSILVALSIAVCLTAEAGNVCNWTGGANDGKWSSAAKLTFAIGEDNTCGNIVLSGALEAATGATIEVDVSNFAGDAKVLLVEAGDLSGFDVQRVVLKGDAKPDVVVKKVGNRLYVRRIRGMVVSFR